MSGEEEKEAKTFFKFRLAEKEEEEEEEKKMGLTPSFKSTGKVDFAILRLMFFQALLRQLAGA
jgi:hypothetical protein